MTVQKGVAPQSDRNRPGKGEEEEKVGGGVIRVGQGEVRFRCCPTKK